MRLTTSGKLGTIKKARLADSVYERLVDAIVTGKLAIGTTLSEVALANELGVSRTPVHEAVRRLVADELLEVLPNRLVRVAELNKESIFEVYEMRKLLEPAATRLACERLSDKELAELREEVDALKSDQSDGDWARRAIDFDIRFHQKLANTCGNRRLCAAITKYRRMVRVYCRISGSSTNLSNALQEHDSILSAMERREAAEAQRAMEQHIENRYRALIH